MKKGDKKLIEVKKKAASFVSMIFISEISLASPVGCVQSQ